MTKAKAGVCDSHDPLVNTARNDANNSVLVWELGFESHFKLTQAFWVIEMVNYVNYK